MFGESFSESEESPRVPSPWDTIISTPPSPSPSPLAAAIPKLVPEQDDGNVEYKLQLLSPSPARFARLVTQMKWRLLEGGGQAYYELGVADSGILVGLPRAELEQSLETLEMMAGEIGASVIIVKEIEVPAAMAGLVGTQTDTWNGKRAQRRQLLMGSEESTDDATATNTETETETEMSATDVDEDDLSATVLLPDAPSPRHRRTSTDNPAVFSMDDLDSAAENADIDSSDIDADAAPAPPQFSMDLEIASVFKPRPMRAKPHHHDPLPPKPKRGPKAKKGKHPPDALSPSTSPAEPTSMPPKQYSAKATNRRQARDRKRDERRLALMMYATAALEIPAQAEACSPVDDPPLVSGLEALHVSVEPLPVVLVSEQTIPSLELSLDEAAAADDADDGEDDVFPSPMTATVPFTAFASQLTIPVENSARGKEISTAPPRLIVEALVVRKLSLEEAFLDFGGFSLT
ncbi:hypothetical protein B0H15DRAFT_866309 [Mycena belliarum]|uniref:GTP binding protein 2 n=1 Tax=Mycena belliarum TaxID=1033014 RepID=A0AAD6TRM1_9AGAR|nr:hypothetical protein B0H15DRAFT_866309 [Mycena belliae]